MLLFYYSPLVCVLQEKRNCPIHVAAQAGQALQVELLVVYGADPGVVDNSHKTPADYARWAISLTYACPDQLWNFVNFVC